MFVPPTSEAVTAQPGAAAVLLTSLSFIRLTPEFLVCRSQNTQQTNLSPRPAGHSDVSSRRSAAELGREFQRGFSKSPFLCVPAWFSVPNTALEVQSRAADGQILFIFTSKYAAVFQLVNTFTETGIPNSNHHQKQIRNKPVGSSETVSSVLLLDKSGFVSKEDLFTDFAELALSGIKYLRTEPSTRTRTRTEEEGRAGLLSAGGLCSAPLCANERNINWSNL